jgi:hypothetical protein
MDLPVHAALYTNWRIALKKRDSGGGKFVNEAKMNLK